MLTLVSLAVAALSATLQTPAPSAAPVTPVERMALPEIPGAVIDPACGGKTFIAGIATCVVSTQEALQGLADQYTAAFEAQGWLQAYGTDNRMVFIKRRDGGGCDGFQVQAFTDEAQEPGPTVPAYMAFATIPGDVCSDPDAAGAVPQ